MSENIYSKLAKVCLELQEKNIKKSGRNKFVGYSYYELSDILPSINELMVEHRLCMIIGFTKELGTLTLINSDDPEQKIENTVPMGDVQLKGAHIAQNYGASQTYARRYLILSTFNICESDMFDAMQGFQEKRDGLVEQITKLCKEYIDLGIKKEELQIKIPDIKNVKTMKIPQLEKTLKELKGWTPEKEPIKTPKYGN